MLDHKISLNKFKKTEVTPGIFSDQNAMKLEINHKKNSVKNTFTKMLNIMLVNNEWVNQESKEEIKKKKIHGDK